MADQDDEANVVETEAESTEEENVDNSTEENNETVQQEGDDANADEEDPLETYRKAILETELERLRKEAREETQRLQEEERQRLEAQRKLEQLKNNFGDTVKTTRDVVKQHIAPLLRDEDGEPIPLSDELFQKIVEPWNTYNTKVSEAEQLAVYSELAAAAIETLAEAQRQEFNTRAANKPLKEYIAIHSELAAPNTDYVKQLKAEHKLAIDAARADGYAKGQRAPKGTPPASPNREIPDSRKSYNLDNLVDAAKALAAGDITAERYREIHNKLRS